MGMNPNLQKPSPLVRWVQINTRWTGLSSFAGVIHLLLFYANGLLGALSSLELPFRVVGVSEAQKLEWVAWDPPMMGPENPSWMGLPVST